MIRTTAIILFSGALAVLATSARAEKPLSKSDIRKFVDRYERIPKEEGQSALSEVSCFSDAERRKRLQMDIYSGAKKQGVARVKTRKIKNLNVEISVEYNDREGVGGRPDYTPTSVKGYLQLTPSGKLKYDPIFYRHPLELAFPPIHKLCWNYNKQVDLMDKNNPDETEIEQTQKSWKFSFDRISTTGIPLFELNGDEPVIDQRERLMNLLEWLETNVESWDLGDPLVPLPEDQSEEMLKRIKKIKLDKPR